MFAKVFGQIFDSSIAEDYNCRRMFMDLLVLADSTGAVDMTTEAIARRTNVPVEEVVKYVKELCQPDKKSRSKLEEGKRLIPLDSNRDWGWQIVNYTHYRKIRDEAARREYFRDKQREHRKKQKQLVKDRELTGVNESEQLLTSPSASSSKSRCTQIEAEQYCTSIGLPASDGTAMFLHWEEKGWAKVKNWKLTIQKWKSFGYLPSQKLAKSIQRYEKPKERAPSYPKIPPRIEQSEEDRDKAAAIAKEEAERFRQKFSS
jgi:hypothetical protein